MARRTSRGHRQTQLTRLLGLLFVVGGFVMIGLGWDGASQQDCVECQLPYLLSGGAAGIGLIVFGCSMLVVAQIKAERIRLGAYVNQVAAAVQSPAGSAPTAPAAAAAAPAVAASPSPVAEASGDGNVVAGRSTYHRPDCALVRGKDDLELLSVEAAVGRGLEPCRACEPAVVPAGA
jgi:hypothetical protein